MSRAALTTLLSSISSSSSSSVSSSSSSLIASSSSVAPLPASLLPTYVNGRWRKPAISALQLARARKAVLSSGAVWPFDQPNGRREQTVKFKGHKAERLAPIKAAKIEQAMKEMPKRVEEYYRIQRSLRLHDTQKSRLLQDSEGADGKKKTKAKPATVTTA